MLLLLWKYYNLIFSFSCVNHANSLLISNIIKTFLVDLHINLNMFVQLIVDLQVKILKQNKLTRTFIT